MAARKERFVLHMIRKNDTIMEIDVEFKSMSAATTFARNLIAKASGTFKGHEIYNATEI